MTDFGRLDKHRMSRHTGSVYLILARESFGNKKKDSKATLYGATGRNAKAGRPISGFGALQPGWPGSRMWGWAARRGCCASFPGVGPRTGSLAGAAGWGSPPAGPGSLAPPPHRPSPTSPLGHLAGRPDFQRTEGQRGRGPGDRMRNLDLWPFAIWLCARVSPGAQLSPKRCRRAHHPFSKHHGPKSVRENSKRKPRAPSIFKAPRPAPADDPAVPKCATRRRMQQQLRRPIQQRMAARASAGKDCKTWLPSFRTPGRN